MLEVRDLYVGYYRDLHILRGVELTAGPGQITAVLGANGVGKSTLLKAIFGLLTPERGEIRFDGRMLLGVPPHRMVDMGVCYLPQQPGIFPQMSVEENLELGAWTYRRDRRRLQQALERNYQRFPVLREKRHQPAGQLSGGQQRMVELARALMTSPRLMLVDEPSAGLAKTVADEVYVMLWGLRDEGLTIVLVDQDIRRALRVADYVYVLDLGRNRFAGSPEEFVDLERVFWS